MNGKEYEKSLMMKKEKDVNMFKMRNIKSIENERK